MGYTSKVLLSINNDTAAVLNAEGQFIPGSLEIL